MLEQNTFDFVELSGGTYESLAFEHKKESTKKRESFFMEFADMIAPAMTRTKVYVTGGFHTVGAMVHALETVDGIGLARPLCHEPQFCKRVLAGKAKGTLKPATNLDEQSFGPSIIAAGTQIRQIGKDQEPTDLSRQENVDAFMKDMGSWAQMMAENSDGLKYGFIDLTSAPIPYGTDGL